MECCNTCKFKKECGNQRMTRRKYPKFTVFKCMDNRGWGMKACSDIKEGQFVIEYVGEVITDEEGYKRIEKQEKHGVPSFYMMALDSGTMIDARRKANNARFINHS
eukprot:UC4_evm1s648